jgi:peroxiredoxin
MVLTPSTMLPLGTSLPAFALPDLNGRMVSSRDFTNAPGLLVAFISHHCPYVTHIRREFARFAREYQERGLAIVAVCSNDAESFPEDGPDGMKEEAASAGYTFPYLFDESQEVAKAFRAACTPDLFLFDRRGLLVYRGQFDDSRPRTARPIPITGKDIRAAADAVLAGQPVAVTQRSSVGCNIKWKRGNAPAYFATHR